MQPVEKPKRMHRIIEAFKSAVATFWDITEPFWLFIWKIICGIGRIFWGLCSLAIDVLELISIFTW